MGETTSKLLRRLRSPGSGMALLHRNSSDPTCRQALRELLERTGVSAAAWMASTNISRSYGYQILRGERVPGRDVLLRTALALGLSLEETQRLLAVSGCGTLYPRVRRDAAVIFALNQHLTLLDTEELLASLPERGLYAGET